MKSSHRTVVRAGPAAGGRYRGTRRGRGGRESGPYSLLGGALGRRRRQGAPTTTGVDDVRRDLWLGLAHFFGHQDGDEPGSLSPPQRQMVGWSALNGHSEKPDADATNFRSNTSKAGTGVTSRMLVRWARSGG